MTPELLFTNNNSLAYEDGDAGGTATGIGALRYRPGRFAGSQAALIEEGTYNHILNPYFQSSGSAWMTQRTTLAYDAVQTPSGADGGQITVTDASNTAYIASTSAPGGIIPDALHAFRCVMRGPAGRRFYWQVRSRTGGTTDTSYFSPQSTMAGAEWVEVGTVADYITAGHTELETFIRAVTGTAVIGDVFDVGEPQVEEKDHHTTLCPELDGAGDLKPGYAWTGAAHGSQSTRAAASITIPYTGTIGSIACWYSEDAGDTWEFSYRESLGSVGSYGSITHDGSTITITSARAILLGPIAVFSDTLQTHEANHLRNLEAVWAWSDLSGVPAPTEAVPVALLTNNHTLAYDDGSLGGSAVGQGAVRWRRPDGTRNPIVHNYLRNPRAATGIANYSNGTARDTTVFHAYNASYRADAGASQVRLDGGSHLGMDVPIPTNVPFYMRVWVLATWSTSARVETNRYNSATEATKNDEGSLTPLTPNVWTELKGVAPANPADSLNWFRVTQFGPVPEGESLYVTEGIFSEEDVPYFDGDDGAPYGWRGTPHNSVSYREFWVTERAVAFLEEATENGDAQGLGRINWGYNWVTQDITKPIPGMEWVTREQAFPAANSGEAGNIIVNHGSWPIPGAPRPQGTPFTASVYHRGQAPTFRLVIEYNGGESIWNQDASLMPSSAEWARHVYSRPLDKPDRTTIKASTGFPGRSAGEAVFMAAFQLEDKDHATTLCPEVDLSGNLLPGYAWSGTANNSISNRAAASIILPGIAPLAGSLACHYSEDFGQTWQVHYGEGPGAIGTYGNVAFTGNDLVITSARTLLLGPVAVWDDALSPAQQAALEVEPEEWTWAFISDIPEGEVPAYPMKIKAGGVLVDVAGYKIKTGGVLVDVEMGT